MVTNLEPSVSLLINELRKIPEELKYDAILYAKKKMARKDLTESQDLLVDLWKKLYLAYTGNKVNPLDFIKATGSPNLMIKRIGYSGVAYLQPEKCLFLIQNTVEKNIKDELYAEEAFIFINNIKDKDHIFKDFVLNTPLLAENNKLFVKCLVAKSKYQEDQFFELNSANSFNLFVKCQLWIQKNYKLTAQCVEYLEKCLNAITCKYTTVKIMQLLQKAVEKDKFVLQQTTLNKLKSYVFETNGLARTQIDISLCIQATRLLLLCSSKWARLNQLITSLVESRSMNSMYLGFKLAIEFEINTEGVISRLLDVGIDRSLYFDVLYKLINEKTYKILYQRLNTMKSPKPENEQIRETRILLILKKICEYGDQEFVCNILFKYPKLYKMIRTTDLISKEQSRILFKSIQKKVDPSFYLMIYDLYPIKASTDEKVANLIQNHLETIFLLTTENKLELFSNLGSFVLKTNNLQLFRSILIDFIQSEKTSQITTDEARAITETILNFNLILQSKLICLPGIQFLEYNSIGNILTVTYPIHLHELLKIEFSDIYKEKTEIIGTQIKKTIEIQQNTKMFVNMNKFSVKRVINITK